MELGYDDEPACIGRMHDVALVDQAHAGAAVERRSDRRVAELGLRSDDRRLIALDLRLDLSHQRALCVQLLARREVLRGESAVALQVELRIGEVGLILGLSGNRLIEHGLVGTGIDLREKISGLDLLTLGERDPDELAVDLGPDRHGVEGLYGTEPGQVDRYVALLRGCDSDRNRGRRKRHSARIIGPAVVPTGITAYCNSDNDYAGKQRAAQTGR